MGQSAGTRGDRSFTDRVMLALMSTSRFQKNQKEKKRKQEEEIEEDDEKHKRKDSEVIWKVVLKTQ